MFKKLERLSLWIERQCPKSGGKVVSKEQVEQGLLYTVAQLVKKLPAMRETWVRSLDWEDPLDKGKATHSSVLAWRIPWTI